MYTVSNVRNMDMTNVSVKLFVSSKFSYENDNKCSSCGESYMVYSKDCQCYIKKDT
jgi:hypothetical protein